VNKTYVGKIDGLIVEIEIMAWDIAGLDPPAELNNRQISSGSIAAKTKNGAILRSIAIPGWGQLYRGKKLAGYTYLGSELFLIGLALKANGDYSQAKTNYDKYKALYQAESDYTSMLQHKQQSRDFYDQMTEHRDQTVMYAGLAGSIWLINTIHAAIIKPDNKTAIRESVFQVGYDPRISQTQLRLTYALD